MTSKSNLGIKFLVGVQPGPLTVPLILHTQLCLKWKRCWWQNRVALLREELFGFRNDSHITALRSKGR